MTKNLISNNRYLPYNPELKERACKMRHNLTLAEKKLWNGFLKNLDYQFYRQKRVAYLRFTNKKIFKKLNKICRKIKDNFETKKKPPLSERGLGDFYLQFLFLKLKND
jgi:very-short-patch-repair endonuclease